ncbi:MAG: hypothetical protein R3F43_10690 [bacterium]
MRRRPGGYAPGLPTFDFAQYSCDAPEGTCPLPPYIDFVHNGQIVDVDGRPAPDGDLDVALDQLDHDTCTLEPFDTFQGMDHQSQFVCGRFVDARRRAGPLDLAVAEAGTAYDPSTCGLVDGEVRCQLGAAANGAVGWASIRTVNDPDAYDRGCQDECRFFLPICPEAYRGRAGCTSEDESFGALVCNDCPSSGNPCVTDGLGLCRPGTLVCEGQGAQARDVCVANREPAAQDVFDASPADGVFASDNIDSNCDGFDGDLSGASGALPIFVRANGGVNGAGTYNNPYRNLSVALTALAGRGEGPFELFIEGGDQAAVGSTLVVPPSVIGLHGRFAPGNAPGCPGAQNGCIPGQNTRSGLTGPAAGVLRIQARGNRALVISGMRITSAAAADGVGAAGATSLAVEIQAGSPVTFIDSEVVAGDGGDGAAGPASPAGRADNGNDGKDGFAGCQLGLRLCAAPCAPVIPPGSDGSGGACACGSDCDGGDGGVGGELHLDCDPNVPQNGGLQRPGSGGDGDTPRNQANSPLGAPAGGRGGMPGMACLGFMSDPDYIGLDGERGQVGAAAEAVAGSWSASGWNPGNGTQGSSGNKGGGGGGGGGGGAGGHALGPCAFTGGHGAGGGAGGCGGVGGRGGYGGGASIGILVGSNSPSRCTRRGSRRAVAAGEGPASAGRTAASAAAAAAGRALRAGQPGRHRAHAQPHPGQRLQRRPGWPWRRRGPQRLRVRRRGRRQHRHPARGRGPRPVRQNGTTLAPGFGGVGGASAGNDGPQGPSVDVAQVGQ